MSILKTILLILCRMSMFTTSASNYDGWTEQSSPLLPGGTSGSAIGHNPSNNTIWILDRYQLISFDYINNRFTDHGTNALPEQVYGYSQNYAQIGDTLYMPRIPGGEYINSFNMKTKVFTTNDLSPSSPFQCGSDCCIVNIRDEYIAVLEEAGGVSILNMDSQDWLSSVPSLIVGRVVASCIYINDKMFIVGGYSLSDFNIQSSIEYLNVSTASMSDIAAMLWQNNIDPLPQPLRESRCVTVNDDILVIGGRGINSSDYSNTIYIIDSISGTVSFGGYLAKAVSNTAVIFVNNIVYSFGGISSGSVWNGWQTKTVETTITTQNPSSTMSSQTRIETSTHRSTDAPFEYVTTNAILSSYEAPIETTIDGSTNVSSSFLTQYALKSISSTEEQKSVVVLTKSTIQSKSTEDKSKTPSSSSLSPITIAIIISTSSCFVIFIVCVFGKICYSQMSEKRLIKVISIDIKSGDNVNVIDNNNDNQEHGEESRTESDHNNDSNKDNLPVTIEGQKDDIIKPNVRKYSDSSDHNNDDLWVESHDQEGAEKVQETIDCTINKEPQTVSGGFYDV